MKSNDFVKYLTVQLVERMDTPKEKKVKVKQTKSSFSSHWFGMIPLSIKMFTKRFHK